MSCTISKITVERYADPLGIQHRTPRLSWRFEGDVKDWHQASYDIKVLREELEEYHFDSDQSLFVAWPSTPLESRSRVTVSVRATSTKGDSTPWSSVDIEAGLLEKADWTAQATSGDKQPQDQAKRPFHLRKSFEAAPGKGRIYVTAFGLYELKLNGVLIGDHVLAPGWQSHRYRLHYQILDVSSILVEGTNELVATIGEGWYAGRLGFAGGKRNIYGDDLGLLLQLEVDGDVRLTTGTEGWEWRYGALVSSEIYDGEHADFSLPEADWRPARTLPRPDISLVAPESPPVRRKEVVQARDIITTPSGKTILDFGQNLVGWVRFAQQPPSSTVTLRHAEVLEHGELGMRPLRFAHCTDSVTAGDHGWEPKFTFHGFRYVEVEGWSDVSLDSMIAVVVYSDMERLGDFECSHAGLTRFHQNTIWGLKGNFVSVPTDCPQRDERLGWTGDLQVFAPTASYLYDTMGLLGNWLEDLRLEQQEHNGVPPLVVPNVLINKPKNFAIWGDVTALTPNALYNAFGDVKVLHDQWQSMVDWLEKGVSRASTGLWDPKVQQLGDWLDPNAPEHTPDDSQSDTVLVANAFLIHTTRTVAAIAKILQRPEAAKYAADAERLVKAFQDEYLTPNGLVMSDSQTTLALALHFDLTHHPEKTARRLEWHVRRRAFQICTGFAGTPVILLTLASNDLLNVAYRMFQEKQCPSLLYPISMGATTIWERWNSMLPDGTINPGEMTSFNHYALGSVSLFLYEIVGGLSSLEPGWKRALFQPRPGGTVTHARVHHLSPYGLFACSWWIEAGRLHVETTVPPNATGRVVLPGQEGRDIASGTYTWDVEYTADPEWPPAVWQPPQMRPQLIDEPVL